MTFEFCLGFMDAKYLSRLNHNILLKENRFLYDI